MPSARKGRSEAGTTEHVLPGVEADPVEALPALVRSLDEPITERPDGYYWAAPDGRQEFGPFATRELAWADMHAGDPDDLEPGESLQEAESEIGMTDWIDPDTGAPAEGPTPHLDDE
jgi:hypothetical protein